MTLEVNRRLRYSQPQTLQQILRFVGQSPLSFAPVGLMYRSHALIYMIPYGGCRKLAWQQFMLERHHLH
jgi:hypothetical protein